MINQFKSHCMICLMQQQDLPLTPQLLQASRPPWSQTFVPMDIGNPATESWRSMVVRLLRVQKKILIQLVLGWKLGMVPDAAFEIESSSTTPKTPTRARPATSSTTIVAPKANSPLVMPTVDQNPCTHPSFQRYGNAWGKYTRCKACLQRWKWNEGQKEWKLDGYSSKRSQPPPVPWTQMDGPLAQQSTSYPAVAATPGQNYACLHTQGPMPIQNQRPVPPMPKTRSRPPSMTSSAAGHGALTAEALAEFDTVMDQPEEAPANRFEIFQLDAGSDWLAISQRMSRSLSRKSLWWMRQRSPQSITRWTWWSSTVVHLCLLPWLHHLVWLHCSPLTSWTAMTSMTLRWDWLVSKLNYDSNLFYWSLASHAPPGAYSMRIWTTLTACLCSVIFAKANVTASDGRWRDVSPNVRWATSTSLRIHWEVDFGKSQKCKPWRTTLTTMWFYVMLEHLMAEMWMVTSSSRPSSFWPTTRSSQRCWVCGWIEMKEPYADPWKDSEWLTHRSIPRRWWRLCFEPYVQKLVYVILWGSPDLIAWCMPSHLQMKKVGEKLLRMCHKCSAQLLPSPSTFERTKRSMIKWWLWFPGRLPGFKWLWLQQCDGCQETSLSPTDAQPSSMLTTPLRLTTRMWQTLNFPNRGLHGLCGPESLSLAWLKRMMQTKLRKQK